MLVRVWGQKGKWVIHSTWKKRRNFNRFTECWWRTHLQLIFRHREMIFFFDIFNSYYLKWKSSFLNSPICITIIISIMALIILYLFLIVIYSLRLLTVVIELFSRTTLNLCDSWSFSWALIYVLEWFLLIDITKFCDVASSLTMSHLLSNSSIWICYYKLRWWLPDICLSLWFFHILKRRIAVYIAWCEIISSSLIGSLSRISIGIILRREVGLIMLVRGGCSR